MTQTGGILLSQKRNSKETILNYLDNSVIELKTQGNSGLIYSVNVIDINKINNPFFIFEASENFKNPVDKLIIKICAIENDKLEFDDSHDMARLIDRNLYIYPIPEYKFVDEINIQTDIFLKTITYLQPICPAIAYSGILEFNDHKQTAILNKLIPKLINAKYFDNFNGN